MFEKPLGLRENPFLAGHHPKYLFPSREHQEALAHLRYGIQNREPFVLITGEVGTGKTTAVYDALAEWGSRAVVALITNSALSRSELLEEICLRFGVSLPSPVTKPQALVELQRQLTAIRQRGELAILLVDEAQNLDRELLEEIRLLSNLEVGGEYLLQIFLVGQPELETKLAQKELRQLRQRIGIHYRILPLSANESARYIHHRVSVAGGNAEELFPSATCTEIYRVTNGIPREINVVAGQSLLNAFVDDARSVTVEHVRAVEREIEFQSVLKQRPEDPGAAPPQALAGPAAAAAPAPVAAAPPPAPVAEGPSRPRLVPPPPPPDVEDEVEVTEVGFLEVSAVVEDVEDDLPARTLDASAFEPIEIAPPTPEVTEPAASATEETRADTGILRMEEGEPLLPSWIDEIVRRRQAIDARMAELAAQAAAAQAAAQSAQPAPLPPPIPLPTGESYGLRRGDPHESLSGARLAAPAPERIAPHPADPIPLFKSPAIDHLPPRLRTKLDESSLVEEEDEKPRRMSMAWPIASVVLAAIAIAILLLVRFGPWTLQRRETAPVNTPAPAPAPEDSSLHSSTPYPPFDKMNQPGSPLIAKRTRRATAPSATGAPPAAAGAQTAGGTTGPAAATPGAAPATDPGTGPASSPTGAAAAGGAIAGGAAAGAGAPAGGLSAPGTEAGDAGMQPAAAGPATYGIVVGTYMNEARASSERGKIREATKLASRVMTVTEDNVTMYRVVVGNYADRSAAEHAASDLVQRGLVEEARVVAMGQTAPKGP